MVRKFLIIFLFLGITIQNSFAEYRVFLLKITKKVAPPITENPSQPTTTSPETPAASTQQDSAAPSPDKTFLSTLDPEQYKDLHPLSADETISYTETWRCFGRTGGGIPLCPNPKAAPAPNPPTSDQASGPETNIQNPIRNPASPP